VRETFDVWGSTIYFDCAPANLLAAENLSSANLAAENNLVSDATYGAELAEIYRGLANVKEFFLKVDQIFSTYKNESEVSLVRSGRKDPSSCSDEFKEVWEAALNLRALTDGAFDPWAVSGGYDPSGIVKGWAADRGVAILQEFGGKSIQINAAGDLTLAGGYPTQEAPMGPWKIGIRDPENSMAVLKVFEIMDGAIATSGSYERGAHIIDPLQKLIAIGAQSATVYGPKGEVVDALATALMVAGKEGAVWFDKPELAEYGCWVIERHTRKSWSYQGSALR
jgi:FAD:protein FMN transferase